MAEGEETHQRNRRDSQVCTSEDAWNAPPSTWFKANWDGAVDRAKGQIRIGVIIRDCNGQVIATMRDKKQMFADPLLAESYGALAAAQLALDLGLQRIVLEGDSLQVTKTLQEEKEAWSCASMIMSETRTCLKHFAKWDVSHVRRNGNKIAHLLAKIALTISELIVTMEDSPSWIYPLL
ncbi:uncharacterized protein LOC122301757 [Carya illinoinensis]|uniref:uncharacterized protein LOC122301757 n=1 Tax=Carya illinoinensis TaxID=32201 RepID=UPI001C7282D3|nr:uncharacterized protein LOC122301757 [Carya illinoinensis]